MWVYYVVVRSPRYFCYSGSRDTGARIGHARATIGVSNASSLLSWDKGEDRGSAAIAQGVMAERSSQVGGCARGRVHLAQQRDGPAAEANYAVDGSMVVGREGLERQ